VNKEESVDESTYTQHGILGNQIFPTKCTKYRAGSSAQVFTWYRITTELGPISVRKKRTEYRRLFVTM